VKVIFSALHSFIKTAIPFACRVTQVDNPNILAANQPSYCAAATANECFILVIYNSCRGQRVEFHSVDQEFCPSNTAYEIELI
jgi:hypothetical protein